MKKVVFLLLVLILFGTAFSTKIDPQLLKDFKKSEGFGTLSVPTENFIVLYSKEVPNGTILHKYKHFNAVLMHGTLSDVYRLAKNPNVIFIYSVNHKFRIFLNETVNNSNSLIGDTPSIFSNYNGSGIKIAVLDTGANWSIIPLNNTNLAGSVDFTGEGTPGDHGTFVISELVSRDTNYPGIVEGAKIYDVKVMNSTGYGDLQWILAGLDYALDKNVNVVSMSLGVSAVGFNKRSEYLDLLFNSIFSRNPNVVFVVAAGNDGPTNYSISQPGSSMNAITVGAINRSGAVESYSSRGPIESNRIKPDVCAVGDIYAFSNSGLAYAQGTSMATPLVAGAAAILNQIGITDANKIKFILMETAKPTGSVWECGAGTINITKAVTVAKNGTYFLILTNHGYDNYIGYVNGTMSFSLMFENLGNSPVTISYNITYYNGTLWKNGTIKVSTTNVTTISLTVPNLPANESYGFIETNNSLEIPFSWAPAKVVSANYLYKNVNGSEFYILNYTQFPDGIKYFFVDLNSSNLTYYSTISDSYADYSGWATNNTSNKFVVTPIYPIQNLNYVIYNMLPWNLTIYGFKFSNSFVNKETFTSGMVKFTSDDFSILVNGTGWNITSSTELAAKPGVIYVNYGNYKEVISTGANVTIMVSNGEYYTTEFVKNIPALSSTTVTPYDSYFIYPYNTTFYTIYQSIISNLGIVLSSNPVKGYVWNPTVTVKLNNGYTGTLPVYLIISGVPGIVSQSQSVVVEKDTSFTNGTGSAAFHVYVPSSASSILVCYDNVSFVPTQNCMQFSTIVGTGSNFYSTDESWVDSVVLEVSKMIHLFTG